MHSPRKNEGGKDNILKLKVAKPSFLSLLFRSSFSFLRSVAITPFAINSRGEHQEKKEEGRKNTANFFAFGRRRGETYFERQTTQSVRKWEEEKKKKTTISKNTQVGERERRERERESKVRGPRWLLYQESLLSTSPPQLSLPLARGHSLILEPHHMLQYAVQLD